jgi:hypothetical protein
MERARPYLKVAAVVSAVALVGSHIAYRAGAFSTPIPTESQPEPPTANPPQPPPASMFGSKSVPAVTPGQTNSTANAPFVPQPAPVAPAPHDKPPTFLSGSKSFTIYDFSDFSKLTHSQSTAPAPPTNPPNMTPPNAPKP